MKEYKNILCDIRGGLGKNFAFARIIPELKQKYEKVSVISPYWDVFSAVPECDYVYKPDEARAAIEDAADDTYIMIDHIYDTNEFVRKEITYQDAFRLACGLEMKDEGKDGSDTKISIDVYKAFPLLKQQVDYALSDIKAKGYKNFILVQFTGSQSPLTNVPANPQTGAPDWSKVPYTGQNTGLSRHYPLDKAQEFVNLFHQEHPDTAIINYNLPNEYDLKDTLKYIMPYLCYAELAKDKGCLGVVGIDSSLPHIISGICPAVIMWHHSAPPSFSYSYNKNLIAHCNRDSIKYFTALGKASNRIDYIQPSDLLIAVNEHLYNKE